MKDSESTQKHHCKFSGCNKSFLRREHLARHARTHSESKYICKVCQKEFTRSDSLQRHLGLHGEAFKPSPSGRSKRACQVCHASKIKCDGDQPCSRCHKRGIGCHYDQIDLDTQKETSKGSTPDPLVFGYRVSREVNDHNPAPPPEEATAAASGDKTVKHRAAFEERLAAALNRSKGLIDWMSVELRNNSPSSPRGENQSAVDVNWPALAESETAQFVEIYFAHFHHRWQILHAPTFEAETAPPVLLLCIIMIGAHIHGTADSTELAMGFHAHVFNYILPQLGHISSKDSIHNSSTLALCEASLLQVIFGLYCGKETILSKSIIVRGMVISALREMGFFNPELPAPYDKPGYFLPLRLVKEAKNQRLCACLFKIDSYLSILRSQPEILIPEELHFELQCTYAFWNADGLDVWEKRQSIEPKSRSQTTICRAIREPASKSFTPTEGLMLIEDVQLGICAMHSEVWQLREKLRDSQDQEICSTLESDALMRRLDAWKYWIDQNPIQQTDHVDFSQEQNLAMQYYYGVEDHSDPGWQLIVFDRPKNLIFDTFMFYHLLSMHLFADVQTLTQLAKDNNTTDSTGISGEMYLKAKERRAGSTRKWVESANARRALCHAIDILVSSNSISEREKTHMDPIAFVALSVSALITWAYCMYSGRGCSDCVSEESSLPFIGASFVELTEWGGPKNSQIFDKDRETWIKTGGCYGAIIGLPLCRCNINLLMAKFRTCIPQGWNVTDTIAPGIFKSLT